MAGGRRNLNRSGTSRQQPFLSSEEKSKGNTTESSKAVSPKHMPMPTLPPECSLTFETCVYFFSILAMTLQFLHLYRSVWWLPNSYTDFGMNFYLMDPQIVGFILIILMRKLLYVMLRKILLDFAPMQSWSLVEQILRLVLLSFLLFFLFWCTYHIMRTHRFVKIFYLCYPISIYLILFGLDVNPFFDTMALPSDLQNDQKSRLIGKPFHSCSSSPQAIREEVETLKTDFNNKLKQILFSSMFNAYYGTFVPCCFAENYLYYDVYWATQHFTFVWIGILTMHITHCYPLSYCDTLHRAALHLGKWAKVEGRTCHLPSHIWTELALWPQGVFVRHSKELYKGEGISNAAEPGNSTHSRFYAVFNNPSILMCSLVGFQLSVVLLQLAILIRTTEWYQLISLSFLLFTNYYTLFKLSRDYLICWRLYKAEAMIQDKSNDVVCVKYKTG